MMYKVLILLPLSFFQINLQTTPLKSQLKPLKTLLLISELSKLNLHITQNQTYLNLTNQNKKRNKEEKQINSFLKSDLNLKVIKKLLPAYLPSYPPSPQNLAKLDRKILPPSENPSNELKEGHVKSIHDLMTSRYTVRTFKSQDLKEEHLDQILGAGLLAPSKNKLFPYRIIVLTNSRKGKRLKQKLWSKYTICYHCSETGDKIEQRINSILTAPVNIVFFLDIKPEAFEKEEDLSKIRNRLIFRAARDAMISATAMMLQAEQLGYGTAFTGANYSMNELKKQIEVPLENTYLVTLSIGYREEPSKTIPKDYKYPKIVLDCQGPALRFNRHTVLKYSNKRNKEGSKIPLVVTKSIDVGPKNTEKTHLIKKY